MGREINQRKAAIIGCGFVGSATAFTLMQSQLFSELVLVDVDFEKAVRKAWELNIRRYVTEFWYTGNLQWKEELLHICQKFNELLEEISNS